MPEKRLTLAPLHLHRVYITRLLMQSEGPLFCLSLSGIAVCDILDYNIKSYIAFVRTMVSIKEQHNVPLVK
jgi:hypothetical protein